MEVHREGNSVNEIVMIQGWRGNSLRTQARGLISMSGEFMEQNKRKSKAEKEFGEE